MKVECAWCGKHLGEKCPYRSHPDNAEPTVNVTGSTFACGVCRKFFEASAGGVSHGICAECKQRTLIVVRRSHPRPIGDRMSLYLVKVSGYCRASTEIEVSAESADKAEEIALLIAR